MDVLSESERRLWRYWAGSGVAGGAPRRGLRSSPRWGLTARRWRALRGATMCREARFTNGAISSGSEDCCLRRPCQSSCR